jgi:hypothetical protein
MDDTVEMPESESLSLDTLSDVDSVRTVLDAGFSETPPSHTSQLQFLAHSVKNPDFMSSPNRVPVSVLMFRRHR